MRNKCNIRLEVFNILGQKIKTPVNGEMEMGLHSVVWDSNDNNGNELASGIYFLRIKAGDFIDTKKMVILK